MRSNLKVTSLRAHVKLFPGWSRFHLNLACCFCSFRCQHHGTSWEGIFLSRPACHNHHYVAQNPLLTLKGFQLPNFLFACNQRRLWFGITDFMGAAGVLSYPLQDRRLGSGFLSRCNIFVSRWAGLFSFHSVGKLQYPVTWPAVAQLSAWLDTPASRVRQTVLMAVEKRIKSLLARLSVPRFLLKNLEMLCITCYLRSCLLWLRSFGQAVASACPLRFCLPEQHLGKALWFPAIGCISH